MNILFISHSNQKLIHLDPSVRYRCYHFSEELNRMGYHADVCHFDMFKDVYMTRYDGFIFHKPRFSRRLVRTMRELETLGKTVWADFDDLVFDEKLAEQSPLFLCGRASKTATIGLQREYRQALLLFGHVMVSTQPLAGHVRRVHPDARVAVVHNGLCERWVHNARYLYARENRQKWIGYFPGTSTHYQDFKLVAAVLSRFLESNQDVRLLVLGPLAPSDFGLKMDQVFALPAVAYDQLPYWIMQCWLTIAPLSDTVFNQCKSRLKLIESVIWGVPLVASPIDDLKRCPTEVLYAATDSQWFDQLNRLKDDACHARISAVNYRWACRHAMARNHINAWLPHLHASKTQVN